MNKIIFKFKMWWHKLRLRYGITERGRADNSDLEQLLKEMTSHREKLETNPLLTFYKSKNTEGGKYCFFMQDEIDSVTLDSNMSFITESSIQHELFNNYGKITMIKNHEDCVNIYEHTKKQIIEFRKRFTKECDITVLLDQMINMDIDIFYSTID